MTGKDAAKREARASVYHDAWVGFSDGHDLHVKHRVTDGQYEFGFEYGSSTGQSVRPKHSG